MVHSWKFEEFLILETLLVMGLMMGILNGPSCLLVWTGVVGSIKLTYWLALDVSKELDEESRVTGMPWSAELEMKLSEVRSLGVLIAAGAVDTSHVSGWTESFTVIWVDVRTEDMTTSELDLSEIWLLDVPVAVPVLDVPVSVEEHETILWPTPEWLRVILLRNNFPILLHKYLFPLAFKWTLSCL